MLTLPLLFSPSLPPLSMLFLLVIVVRVKFEIIVIKGENI